MGLADLLNGKKKHYKVMHKCSTGVSECLYVCCTKGQDLKAAINSKDEEILSKLSSHHCDKCLFGAEEINLEDVHGAKKVFKNIEI